MDLSKPTKQPVSFSLVIKRGESTEMRLGTDDVDLLLAHIQVWIKEKAKGGVA